MRVLIIGKGGREHAIAWKLSQSKLLSDLYFAPGNPGMNNLGSCIDISENSITKLADFAEHNEVDLTIVGPESSLALGIVNEFEKRGLKIFGPTREAAQIESSKDFAKSIMTKYSIPTAKYNTFTDYYKAVAYVMHKGAPIVIKEDGLKSGKGVTVAFSIKEAIRALVHAFEIQENSVVIEEFLEGEEFSIIALVNGETVIPLEIARDHKRAYDNDGGPNTGGMGIISPVPRMTPKIVNEAMEEIMKPTAKALVKEGRPFKGFLFGGIMLTSDGLKTIEFNARFGDPEAQGILPRMKSDLLQVILDILEGNEVHLEWDERYALGVVLASKGYPHSSFGDEIVNIPKNIGDLIFHMGTKEENGAIKSSGGRVLTVVALGDSLAEAKESAYKNIEKIKCNDSFFRRDIGGKNHVKWEDN